VKRASHKRKWLEPVATSAAAKDARLGPIHLFDIASRQAQWLTVRQTAIAENISNVNTPGYRSGDVAPFDSIYDMARLTMVTSDPRHLRLEDQESGPFEVEESKAWEVHHSGNSVSLEQELLKANEVSGDYSLNRSISKAFNRMLLASLKG
jgi:flagellar basal-body rod protein FlgB